MCSLNKIIHVKQFIDTRDVFIQNLLISCRNSNRLVTIRNLQKQELSRVQWGYLLSIAFICSIDGKSRITKEQRQMVNGQVSLFVLSR